MTVNAQKGSELQLNFLGALLVAHKTDHYLPLLVCVLFFFVKQNKNKDIVLLSGMQLLKHCQKQTGQVTELWFLFAFHF